MKAVDRDGMSTKKAVAECVRGGNLPPQGLEPPLDRTTIKRVRHLGTPSQGWYDCSARRFVLSTGLSRKPLLIQSISRSG